MYYRGTFPNEKAQSIAFGYHLGLRVQNEKESVLFYTTLRKWLNHVVWKTRVVRVRELLCNAFR